MPLDDILAAGAPLDLRIRAEMERRKRELVRRTRHRFDVYGDECGCAGKDGEPLPLGHCKAHYRARPAQRPPGSYRSALGRPVDDWDIWLIEAGRGFGKTWTGAVFVTQMVLSGRWERIALVNNTVKDVRTVQVEALLQVCPPWIKCVYEPSKASVTWYDEDGRGLAVATIYSAETPEALRGPQFHGAWCDETAKWEHRQQETWDQLQFGLRLGDHPQVVVTTTPRPTPTYLAIRKDPRTAITRGTTDENRAQLAETFIRTIHAKYDGTRLGQQELHAAVLLDAPGALWTTDLLDRTRVPIEHCTHDERGKLVPAGVRLVAIHVGVDPSAGNAADPDKEQDEAGIVVSARGDNGHGYILEDRTVKGSPEQWAAEALRAYQEWMADEINPERNNGGDMVESVIRNAKLDGRPLGRLAKIDTVWASRNKRTRAEPLAMLFEQGRCHIVGSMPRLEAQMTGWVPDEGECSPDRLDAAVWSCWKPLIDYWDDGDPVAG